MQIAAAQFLDAVPEPEKSRNGADDPEENGVIRPR